MTPDFSGLTNVLKLAIKKVPVVKFALGIAGIAAAIAIINLFGISNVRIPVINILIMLGLMVLLFVFASLTTSKDKALRIAGYILVYFVVLIAIIVSSVLTYEYLILSKNPQLSKTLPEKDSLKTYKFSINIMYKSGEPVDISTINVTNSLKDLKRNDNRVNPVTYTLTSGKPVDTAIAFIASTIRGRYLGTDTVRVSPASFEYRGVIYIPDPPKTYSLSFDRSNLNIQVIEIERGSKKIVFPMRKIKLYFDISKIDGMDGDKLLHGCHPEIFINDTSCITISDYTIPDIGPLQTNDQIISQVKQVLSVIPENYLSNKVTKIISCLGN